MNSRWVMALGAAAVAVLAACSDTGSTPVPTLTLIPATATPTAVPPGPTATPQNLTSPQDLMPTRAAATQAQSAPGLSLVDVDPVAADLAALAQRLQAEQANLPVRRVRVVDVQAVVWPDTSLGCPQPDQMYAQVQVPGYRIVVEAAGEQVIFHTDFDRALLCRPEDEVLPPGVMLRGEETPEATPEP
jgi:hypothetical protein